MAESSVQSAVQRLGNLLLEEQENLGAIKENVEQLRDELDWMHCFLREADASRYIDPRVRRWVVQIQEIAYEAEEIVENFLFKFISHQKQEYAGKTFVIKNKLERLMWYYGEAKAIHDANNEIGALRAKIGTLTSRLQAYGIKITKSDSGFPSFKVYGLDAIKEDKRIGLDDHVLKIVSDLVSKAGEMRVIGIWGKNGVGKSTLAREVYLNNAIRRHFNIFSWVYIPKNCNIIDLHKGILASLSTKSSDDIVVMTDQELINELYEVLLEKKCLVVLDNLWSFEIWDGLKAAFPGIEDEDSQSKFLFTTDNRQVAEKIHNGAIIHELKCISYDESWELLRSKLGGIPAQIFGNDGTRSAPNMLEMAKKMLKFCQGVPLAIIALGGLLATKKTSQEWEDLFDFMSSQNLQQSHEKVIELCYYALPSYLKNCFLQLGSFPEDFDIPTKKLCNMWVSEGIAVSTNGVNSRGELSEDFAENCLSELLQRGMVQVSNRKTSNGRIKSCKIHGIMRDLCLKVSKEENFLSIMEFHSNEILSGKIRRLALCLGEEGKDHLLPCLRNPILRSLLLFPPRKEILRPEINHASVRALCRDSQLLRILDLEGVIISSKTLPKEIGDFIYLRYLSVRDMHLTKLPPTIGCLRWLETLDLRAKIRVEIPNMLWCLERLKSLYLPCYFTIKDSEKLRLDNLKHVLTLRNVNHFLVEDVLAMRNLRDASVRYMPENEHIEFIKKSPKVVFSLTIFRAIIGKEQVNVLISFDNLIKLELKGEVTVPVSSLEFPQNLKKLVLDFCGIMQDPMPTLEKHPNLRSLCLDHQAYVGEKLACSVLGFPKLTYLRLNGLKNLQEWNVQKGAMPNLKFLDVKSCELLVKIPEELPQQVQITRT